MHSLAVKSGILTPIIKRLATRKAQATRAGDAVQNHERAASL